MIEFHAITVHGSMLVAQVVDGELVIPPGSAPAAVPPPPTPAWMPKD